jgi:hypothetical protein
MYSQTLIALGRQRNDIKTTLKTVGFLACKENRFNGTITYMRLL